MRIKLSIIIPVFKGEATLLILYKKISDTLSGKYDFEVIFVDDNSQDDSWKIIRQLHHGMAGSIKGFRLDRNYGQHEALLYGMRHSTGQYIVTMDEDMQHDPEYIPEMISFMNEMKLDVLYAKFREYRRTSLHKLESGIARKIAVFLIPVVHKDYSPYRIIRSEIADNLHYGSGTVFLDAILGRATSKIGSCIIEHRESSRPSSYSPFKRILLALSIITSHISLFHGSARSEKKHLRPEVIESVGI